MSSFYLNVLSGESVGTFYLHPCAPLRRALALWVMVAESRVNTCADRSVVTADV